MQTATMVPDFKKAVRPGTSAAYVPFRRCRDCDVEWRDSDKNCWVCGVDVTLQLAPWQTAPAACEECGNDDPCEGYRLCSDCLEELHP